MTKKLRTAHQEQCLMPGTSPWTCSSFSFSPRGCFNTLFNLLPPWWEGFNPALSLEEALLLAPSSSPIQACAGPLPAWLQGEPEQSQNRHYCGLIERANWGWIPNSSCQKRGQDGRGTRASTGSKTLWLQREEFILPGETCYREVSWWV